MSKQSFKIIFSGLIIIIMFGLLKNMFSENNDEELKSIINNAYLVDVRTPAEYAEGNVPGSVNIPLDQVQNQLTKFKNHENIVVFCRSGNRSGQAKAILEQNGFTNVVNGGTWQQINTIKDGAGK
ncbi:rhodanese-like domain-containing protein [Paenimyroides tangerinum]|nr:rhodanese-like domain-containing protein [Paenimyroides tangerinum]